MAEPTHEDQPTAAQKGQGGLLKWTPSLPIGAISMLNPFSGGEENTKDGNKSKEKDKAEKDSEAQAQQSVNKRTSMFAGILPSALLPGSATGSGDKTEKESKQDDDLVMFAEPDTRSNSDEGSRDGSIFDELGRKKTKRSRASKTSYSICHPPPTSTTRQRLHRRPRSMMQLHRLSAETRPLPAFEVIHSANFNVRLTKDITRVFKAKHGICPNDLVVLRAEKYNAAGDESDEEQSRDIISLICKGRPGDNGTGGKARICLPGGREWEAYPTPNGGYEFFTTDEHGLGLTVRWVVKKGKDGSKQTDAAKRRFNFSTISPNSRRHPVIATLSSTKLDVNDTYKIPDPNASTPMGTPKQDATLLADAMEDESTPAKQEHCRTDARLREVIVMTGIWVAFKEGWSPFYKYEDRDSMLGVQRSPSMMPNSPAKASTFSIGSPVPTPPGSPAQTPLQKRSSLRSVTGSLLKRNSASYSTQNRLSTVSMPEAEEDPAFDAAAHRTGGRSRANSNSTVLVHHAASNRRRKNEAAWRPELLSAQQENVNEDRSLHTVDPATPTRRSSVARPILPPTQTSETSELELAAPSSKRASVPSAQKRESSATEVSNSEALAKPAGAGKKKAKSGWRRILCGSGKDL